MNTGFKPNKYVYFTLLSDFINRASNGFILRYTDESTGNEFLYEGERGNPKRYSFNKTIRTLRIPAANKELVEAIRNHPECQDSPNGTYRKIGNENIHVNALFKMLDEEGDAKLAIDGFALRKEANDLAFELMKDQNAALDAQIVLGINKSGDLGNHDMLQYANTDPGSFIKQIKSIDFKSRALVKRAIAENIIYKDGVVYRAGELEFGVDLEEAISIAVKDEIKRSYLERKVNGLTEEADS